MSSVAIVGAGVVGRLVALKLLQKNWKVTLFDKDTKSGTASCSYVGAGMLSPLAEIEHAETRIFELGLQSMALWEQTLTELIRPVYYKRAGSLFLAHPQNFAELERAQQHISSKVNDPSLLSWVNPTELADIEPSLSHWARPGLFLPCEGQIDNRELLVSLEETLVDKGIDWREGTAINHVEAGAVVTDSGRHKFDMVFDCRGLGAQDFWKDLRGVRGELVYLHAPEVGLTRPVRLIHPRYRVYIVPRPGNIFVVGASQIESQDFSPISVRSILELLSAAYSIHPGFAEARLISSHVHCRPAFPDNFPRIERSDGIIRINGLFRHGFLLTPIVVDEAIATMENSNENRIKHFTRKEI